VALAALRRLNFVTGVPGLPARSLSAPGQHITHTHWGWNDSPSMPGWRFEGNTSSDEMTGHIPGYTLALLLAGDALTPSERQLCVDLITNITVRIVKDGFVLIDVNGLPTRWGNWAPAQLNDDPAWVEERGINSVQILSFLLCAHRITGRVDLEAAFNHLVRQHGYGQNMVNARISAPDDINGYDDNNLFLPYLGIHYACKLAGASAATIAMCDSIAAPLQLSVERSYQVVAARKSALWAMIYATMGGGEGGKGASIGKATAQAASAAAAAAAAGQECLQRYPTEMVLWPTDSSSRLDLPTNPDLLPTLNVSSVALPRDESVALDWGSSPFARGAGGSGMQAADPVNFVLPFWLARREGLLV
jgi:hypothetical protein